jgi:hypothetical protein
MATRYWVGGSGSWNAASTTNWSATSGGAGGASAPTNADDVIFNSASSGGSYTVTLTLGNSTCKTMTVDGPATGTVTFAGTTALVMSGTNPSIVINTPLTVSWTNTGQIQWTGSGTGTLNTNGCSMASTWSQSGGATITTTLSSDFTLTSNATLSTGTLALGAYTFTCAGFNNASGLTRTLNFNTGSFYITGTGATAYTQSTETGLTFGQTPIFNMTYNGASALTINTGTTPTQAQTPSFNLTAGSYALTLTTGWVNNINFTGFAGSIAAASVFNAFGNVTFSSGMTVTTTTNVLTFAATSGPKTITTNNVSITRPIVFNGSGGSWQLQDALTMANSASRTLTMTNGTLDLNGKTLSTIGFVTAAGTKNVTFNGGTLLVFGSGATAFNNAAPTNFSTTAGAQGKGFISMTSATAKTFVGGGSNYNATLVQTTNATGALTISGNNTLSSIKNTAQPTSIIFTSGSNNTFTDDFKLKGTGGALVAITATTSGVGATITKLIASGNVNCDYISVKDNTPAGGAFWYAGAHSTLVSNYTGVNGWFGRPPPSANTEFLAFL